jgi:hypothetical protein
MTLLLGSIKYFDDFIELFVKRYNHIKVPRVIVDSFLDMKQGPTEKTRVYVHIFKKNEEYQELLR